MASSSNLAGPKGPSRAQHRQRELAWLTFQLEGAQAQLRLPARSQSSLTRTEYDRLHAALAAARLELSEVEDLVRKLLHNPPAEVPVKRPRKP